MELLTVLSVPQLMIVWYKEEMVLDRRCLLDLHQHHLLQLVVYAVFMLISKHWASDHDHLCVE
jgi:hypothetical protein